MEQPHHLRSKYGRAKGLGSAKEGVHHWWVQRVTAVALVPLCVWLIASVLFVLQSPDPSMVAGWLSSPYQALAMALFILMIFLHAKLGLQVVIEDYSKCKCSKFTLLLMNNFICYAAAAVGVLAILKLHLR